MLILHAIENNAVSLFTDCPHREKLGWLEETHLMAPSMLYRFRFCGPLCGDRAQYCRCAAQWTARKPAWCRTIAPQYVVFEPKLAIFNDSPEWGSAAVLAPWYVYERTGDRAFLAAQYDVMRAYARILDRARTTALSIMGLATGSTSVRVMPGFSKLTTAGVTGTAIYYQDLKVLEKTAALHGQERGERRAYAEQAEQRESRIQCEVLRCCTARYDKGSQTAQAMPLALGMVPDSERAAVLERARGRYSRASESHNMQAKWAITMSRGAARWRRSDVLLDMLERTDAPSYGYILCRRAQRR